MEDIVNNLIEITFEEKDDFLRLGRLLHVLVLSRKEKELFQSCHILHKRGKYYIVHFKNYFLDGKQSNFDESDVSRRNTIIDLLQQWNLISVVDKTKVEEKLKEKLSQIKIVSFKEKQDWKLTAKYSIGSQNK